ncbi:hypothetical protein CKO38_02460 [Rhodospirillum rubrum]|uniref:PDDEXK-like family protein n=2 Tax=Rhodospirillum rubrum TaxID=1085 RepID=UPI001A90FE2C|nr:PD-(D/E)XK nuclease family protein [Rhodospirillum rubrum]MBK1663381.1 hypothetical protein [Rhodospirillum rubrum]MBK1675553.1 hypothetical protein [Rhodospirillum rubrum]
MESQEPEDREKMAANREGGLLESERPALCPDPVALAAMLSDLRAPMASVKTIGNPWSVASLRRDELRNSSVLAWFLNPKGDHGFGDLLLQELFSEVKKRTPSFPKTPSPACFLTVEECPDGAQGNRVDITIDDPGQYFLVIEVKIDAIEQNKQVERYCDVARARACDGRPWAVVFLTPQGKNSDTAGDQAAKVVPLAWSTIASWLRTLSPVVCRDADKAAARHLARTFADHILEF